jgi:hypothetical protein
MREIVMIVASVLFEPIHALNTYIRSHEQIPVTKVYQIQYNKDTIPPGSKKIPPDIANKINDFIQNTLKISKEHVCLLETNNESSNVTVTGSLKHIKKFTILFSSSYVASLKEQAELTKSDKFLIAHEVAHMIYDDTCEGDLEKEKEASKYRLLAFLITGCVLTSMSYGWFTTYLAACGVAKLAGFLRKSTKQREFELRADTFFAEKLKEVAEGGVEYFFAQQDSNQLIRNNRSFYERAFVEKNTSVYGKTIARLIAKVKTIQTFLEIDSKGNFRADWDHPALSQRIANLKGIISLDG